MKVILQDDVKNLGKSGAVVEVKDGYGRNFLIPRNLAVAATMKNLSALEHQKKVIAKKIEKRKKETGALLETLQNHSITVAKAVGKEEKLYGSVTTSDIEAALREENFKVDKKRIALSQPIRALGVYPVKIVLDENSEVEIKVWVVAK